MQEFKSRISCHEALEKEVPFLVLSPFFFFLTKNKPLLFQLSSCSRSLPPFSQGGAEKCCLAFSSYAARFLLRALCVLVGGGGGRGRAGMDALIPQFPVSGRLGLEPWEAGGLNSENP